MMYRFFLLGMTCFMHAATRYQERLVDHFDNPYLLYNAGCDALQEKNYEQACLYFEQACQFAQALPESSQKELWYNHGNSAALQQDYDQALSIFERYEERFPGDERVTKKIDYLRSLKEQQSQENQSEKPEQSSSDEERSKDSQSQDQHEQAGKGNEQQRDTHDTPNRDQQQREQHNDAQSKQNTENAHDQGQDETERKSSDQKGADEGKEKQHNGTPQQKKYDHSQDTKKIDNDRVEQLVQGAVDQDQQFQKEFIKAQTQGMGRHVQGKRW